MFPIKLCGNWNGKFDQSKNAIMPLPSVLHSICESCSTRPAVLYAGPIVTDVQCPSWKMVDVSEANVHQIGMVCFLLNEPKTKEKRLPINRQEDNNPASCPTGNSLRHDPTGVMTVFIKIKKIIKTIMSVVVCSSFAWQVINNFTHEQ